MVVICADAVSAVVVKRAVSGSEGTLSGDAAVSEAWHTLGAVAASIIGGTVCRSRCAEASGGTSGVQRSHAVNTLAATVMGTSAVSGNWDAEVILRTNRVVAADAFAVAARAVDKTALGQVREVEVI